MSKRRFCDRWGNETRLAHALFCRIRFPWVDMFGKLRWQTFDLCPDCSRQLKSWAKNERRVGDAL